MRSKGRLNLPAMVLNIVVLVSSVSMLFVMLLISLPSHVLGNKPTLTATLPPIKTVFVIMMENNSWSNILGSTSAPYINKTLLPIASYANKYSTPPGNHPSEPNYLWLEAGTNFGIHNDLFPSTNHQSTTNHLVTLLNNAGISWKSYQEGISGTTCPLISSGFYAPKHNPMVFFDDVTGTNNPNSQYCISHVRPYTELTTDLQNNTVANYNFITPDLCDDMHGAPGCTNKNSIKSGDTWLSNNISTITNSQAYKTAGALFITWDEGFKSSDGPIGMIVLSPLAKGGGYSNAIPYTHSSTLRTIEEIFGVTPLLGDAANATDLSDLFITSTSTNTATPTTTDTPTDTPTPTLTASVTASPSPTASVTPSTTPGTTLAQDTFMRPNQALWGTASDGQRWGADANTLSAFSISANAGHVTSSGTNRYSAILGASTADAEVLFSGSLSNFSNSSLGAVLRWTSATAYYQALLESNRLTLLKQFNGSITRLGGTSFPLKAGTTYTVRFQVVGSTLSAKAWVSSASEPTGWMLSATDSSLTSGYCGLHMYLQNAVTAQLTAFQSTAS